MKQRKAVAALRLQLECPLPRAARLGSRASLPCARRRTRAAGAAHRRDSRAVVRVAIAGREPDGTPQCQPRVARAVEGERGLRQAKVSLHERAIDSQRTMHRRRCLRRPMGDEQRVGVLYTMSRRRRCELRRAAPRVARVDATVLERPRQLHVPGR